MLSASTFLISLLLLVSAKSVNSQVIPGQPGEAPGGDLRPLVDLDCGDWAPPPLYQYVTAQDGSAQIVHNYPDYIVSLTRYGNKLTNYCAAQSPYGPQGTCPGLSVTPIWGPPLWDPVAFYAHFSRPAFRACESWCTCMKNVVIQRLQLLVQTYRDQLTTAVAEQRQGSVGGSSHSINQEEESGRPISSASGVWQTGQIVRNHFPCS